MTRFTKPSVHGGQNKADELEAVRRTDEFSEVLFQVMQVHLGRPLKEQYRLASEELAGDPTATPSNIERAKVDARKCVKEWKRSNSDDPDWRKTFKAFLSLQALKDELPDTDEPEDPAHTAQAN